MNIEYAKELLQNNREQAQKWQWKVSGDVVTARSLLVEIKILNEIEKLGSQKTKDIIKTIKEKIGNKYFKITDKMQHCIIEDALSKITIDDLIERAFGKKEEKLMNKIEACKFILENFKDAEKFWKSFGVTSESIDSAEEADINQMLDFNGVKEGRIIKVSENVYKEKGV